MNTQGNTEQSLEGLWEREQNVCCRAEACQKSHSSEIQKSKLELLIIKLIIKLLNEWALWGGFLVESYLHDLG